VEERLGVRVLAVVDQTVKMERENREQDF
jgi:hypothetical protein